MGAAVCYQPRAVTITKEEVLKALQSKQQNESIVSHLGNSTHKSVDFQENVKVIDQNVSEKLNDLKSKNKGEQGVVLALLDSNIKTVAMRGCSWLDKTIKWPQHKKDERKSEDSGIIFKEEPADNQ